MEHFDTIVIGGGITGATALHHLTAAGYDALLLEGSDFASGTTSRTSRLQYCGLAYLAGFEHITQIVARPAEFLERLGLARLSMRERSAFAGRSPERLKKVDFYLPIFSHDAASPWKMRAGFKILDAMDKGGGGLDYRYLDATAAKKIAVLAACSSRGRLLGAIHYVEYRYNWPERICLDTIMNSVESGAKARNYSPVDRLQRDGDDWLVFYTDQRSGEQRSAKARTIVNAAGAWVDDIARGSRLTVPQLNQGEKGTNIAIRLPAEFQGEGLQTLARDSSPFYLIPWGNLHYAGPVNSMAKADSSGFVAQEAEIDALLSEIAYLFPNLALTREDVIYSWAGVRPRTYATKGEPGGAGPKLRSPEATGLPGYFVYTGGLLMMHGHIGREIAEGVAKTLKPRGASRAVKVGARPLAEPDQRGSITSTDGISYSISSLNALMEEEATLSLEDLMFRRTQFGWNEHLGTDTLKAVADAVCETAGWSADEVAAQVAAYRTRLQTSHKFRG